MYQWGCPQCSRVTSVINSMRDSHVPPTKCEPELTRTEQVGADGKPIFQKHESCGFEGNDTNDVDNSIYKGWKKLIGSTTFTVNGDNAANSYGLRPKYW